jgi:uncharacterized protein (UPF0371 family)
MVCKIGFSNERYLKEQSESILDRSNKFGKLYLEFGGKLINDMHAARVLPGFDANNKVALLQRLKGKIEIVICIHAGDIERKKIRADFGIPYDLDLLKLIDDLRDWDLEVAAVLISRFDNQPPVIQFKRMLERRDIHVYTHKAIMGYPNDLNFIVSEQGYGAVVSAPGPGSGKMATCLSQVYHEHKHGVNAGYAKFETFPIWNLPLKHPVNMAYEAATADLGDVNMIDPFHLEAYNQVAINYNRDIEIFPVLKQILDRITGNPIQYRSPTDMGVNKAGFAITDDEAVKEAAKQEIIRRYYRYSCSYVSGQVENKVVERTRQLMNELNLNPTDRNVVGPARQAAIDAEKAKKGNEGIYAGAAIELKNGSIITGKNSPLMHASSAVVLNAIKVLAGIPDSIPLLSLSIIESIGTLKKELDKSKQVSLNLEETLIALSISATTNPTAQFCMAKLKELRGCEMHLTHMPTPGDEAGLRSLGVQFTADPAFSGKNLFVN